MDIELHGVDVPPLFKIKHLRIAAKEKVLIYGPSGRGKTSLLHLLGGLWQPTHGEILIDGVNLCAMNDEELSKVRRERIGFVFQKMNLIEHMSSRENLLLVSAKNAASQSDVANSLHEVGLQEKENTWAGALSLGEQQRLAVARVLLQNPELILADEPTSSLDEVNALKVMKLLLEAGKDKTLIVVSHDSRLQKYFDRCLNFEELIQ